MLQRIVPSALIVLGFAYLAVLCVRDLLDDLGVVAAVPGRAAGGPVLILLDIFCGVVCAVFIAAFMIILLDGIKSATSSGGLLPRR
jgi:hypothetical protein